MARGMLGALRLILPVALLLTALVAAQLYSDTPVRELDPWFDDGSGQVLPGSWLTLGHILLPFTFFAVHLANRRFGLAYAVAQIFLAWLAIGVLIAGSDVLNAPLGGAIPSTRTSAAFVGALIAAQLGAAWVFDRTRGVWWWQAPLLGSLVGAILFAGLFYPLAYLGTGFAWTEWMWLHLAAMIAMAVAMLVPYWMLRRLVPPLPGFGGY